MSEAVAASIDVALPGFKCVACEIAAWRAPTPDFDLVIGVHADEAHGKWPGRR